MKRGIDYTAVSVVYFCHDGEGNVIFSKRGSGSRDEQGRWDIGGGGLEYGQTAEQTLRKEIAEEYCTDVLSYEFLGFRDVFREHEGEKSHWVALDFKVLVDPSKVKNGEPHKLDDVRFFPVDNMPSPQHSQFPHFLEKYKEQLFA